MMFPPQLDIPSDVLEIARTLEQAGYEAWCVGGALRDTLLGESNTDYDIATSATPAAVQGLFRTTVAVGERFGTIAVRNHRRYHEVTTFRRDVRTDGRHPVVEYGASLEEDLARRDFTINALAYHPLRHEWRDPFNGAADLTGRIIRAVGDPASRFREDYLRVLRALRFSARLDFTIESATWAALVQATSGLGQLSAERVRDEWFKSLRSARSLERVVELWLTSGAARIWLPELLSEQSAESAPPLSATGFPPPHSGAGRLSERGVSLRAIQSGAGKGLPRDPVLLTTLLCLDPVAALLRLKAANAEIARAAAIMTGTPAPDGDSPVSVRRWLAAVGDAANDLARVWQLRHGAAPPWAATMQKIRERGEPLTRRQLAVSGEDLRAAGIAPGPQMGLILDRLLSLVVDDPSLNTREALLARARAMA